MDSMSRYIDRNLRNIFLFIISVAIVLIQAELYFFGLLTDFWHIAASAFGVSAAILCLLAIFLHGPSARIISFLLIACSSWGLLGTLNHLFAEAQLCIDKSVFDALGDLSMAEQHRPAPLAPLGFAGLCIMGAIAALAGKRGR